MVESVIIISDQSSIGKNSAMEAIRSRGKAGRRYRHGDHEAGRSDRSYRERGVVLAERCPTG